MELLQISTLVKTYEGKVSMSVLKGIQLSIQRGEFVAIMGPSGSGKTTLLNMVATIDTPTNGEVLIHGTSPHRLSKNKLAQFRRRELGFVFQHFNLLNTLTVEEKIVLPLTLEGMGVRQMQQDARTLAERLGISSIMNKRTFEISGGQMQRCAIARAIIHKPKLLLADEPTGNLDSKSSRDVMETLESINKADGMTMMMVTHDANAASYCDRVIFIKDGELYNEISSGGNRKVLYQHIMDTLSILGVTSMNFRQFAIRNVFRNKRTYAAYFLSSAFSVMIIFIYSVLAFHPGMKAGLIQSAAVTAMNVGQWIVYVFSFFFILYSVGAFLKTRQHEFGVLMIQGMSSGQLNRLVFLENKMIGLVAIATGIGAGLVFSK